MYGYTFVGGIGRAGIKKCGMTDLFVSFEVFTCRL